jgi:hypothetical protein
VLTAANVNDFLMKQAVMVFADAAARTSALDGDEAEGMLTYNLDTAALEVYDGTAFVPAAPAPAPPGLVAVKSALFTGVQTNSTAVGANFAVTNLSITHTLADAANKLIISAYLGVAATSAQTAGVGLAVADDGTLIGIGDASGSRTQVAAGGLSSVDAGTTPVRDGQSGPRSITFVYAPGDTNAHTYTVRAISTTAGTVTVYINRTSEDGNAAGTRPRGSSGLVIQEVTV